VGARTAVLERGVARERAAYRSQQAALAAALDDIERLKNTLEAASDGLAAERGAGGHARCARGRAMGARCSRVWGAWRACDHSAHSPACRASTLRCKQRIEQVPWLPPRA
jgi:hypothetical protein